MQVDRYKIHDIELVVDRLQVAPEHKVRLSQSIQKSLQLGNGLLFLLLNDNGEQVQYSRQLMCEDTGISYEEPSPNTFSFNSPYGASPVCKGLGNVYQVNIDSIMPDPELSINDGAIAPLGEEREAYVFKPVQQIAKKFKFSLDTPFSQLPKRAINILLYGKEEIPDEDNGEDYIKLTEVDMDTSENFSFVSDEYEGIVNML